MTTARSPPNEQLRLHFARLLWAGGEAEEGVNQVDFARLRDVLADHFGAMATETILSPLGRDLGWRLARSVHQQATRSIQKEVVGPNLAFLSLARMLDSALLDESALSETGFDLAKSFEAIQHLGNSGRSDVPVCWTTSGFVSGYLSSRRQKVLLVREDRCLARGDPACHFTVHSPDNEWGHSWVADGGIADERPSPPHSKSESDDEHLVTRSEIMKTMLDMAERFALVDSTVLITGESGTGKERIARLIHDRSSRAEGPFAAINCAAITESLLDSELFGHARGAFTGALRARPGIFEAANHGTLLLDEIGEISPGVQVKLLRVLQEREVRRVGDNHSLPLDVRVIAATNKDLLHQVRSGTFREDLYYRIRVVEVHVPPLRERPEDILPLSELLLARSARRVPRKVPSIPPEVAERLQIYEWPGNVRELESAMERAAALSQDGRLEIDDLPDEIRNTQRHHHGKAESPRPLQEITKEHILATLDFNEGNRANTARQLCIGSATLHRKLKSYGV